MKTPVDCQELVAAIGDAVIASDAQGAIVLWNPGAERMFGYSEAEALGQSLDIIIPERLRGRHWEGYDKSMATGTSRYGHDLLRVPATHKDGRAMSIAFTVAMLFGADGKVNAIVAVIRDETQRFQDDRALRKRLAEAEAKLAAATSASS
ncbi:MAG TPA: PAS domain-containing protein [Burkholderiaceae bacterium]